MNMCRLVWEIPIIEGEHYNPIMYSGSVVKTQI